jgi:hypothetical protein
MSVDQEFQAADYMGDGQDEVPVWIRRSSIYSNPAAAAVLLRFLWCIHEKSHHGPPESCLV